MDVNELMTRFADRCHDFVAKHQLTGHLGGAAMPAYIRLRSGWALPNGATVVFVSDDYDAAEVLASCVRRFTYGVRLRPISFCTVPSGYTSVEAHPDFPHGVVVYPHPLPENEARSFDLVRIPTTVDIELLAERIVNQTSEYAAEYVEAMDDSVLDMPVGAAIDDANMHVDRSMVVPLVAAGLRALVAKGSTK